MRGFFPALIFLLLTVPAIVPAQNELQLQLGQILNKKDIPKKPREMAVHCCFFPFINRKFQGVFYTVAFNRETREIIYLSTFDSKFKTKEGKKIGDLIEVSSEQALRANLTFYGGVTPDGWYPVIGNSWDLPKVEGGPLQALDPFENAKPAEMIRFKILGFAKGIW